MQLRLRNSQCSPRVDLKGYGFTGCRKSVGVSGEAVGFHTTSSYTVGIALGANVDCVGAAVAGAVVADSVLHTQRATTDGADGLQPAVSLVCGTKCGRGVWDATVFTKNRERLLTGEVTLRLLQAVLRQAVEQTESITRSRHEKISFGPERIERRRLFQQPVQPCRISPFLSSLGGFSP
jgi:hypothetical protein